MTAPDLAARAEKLEEKLRTSSVVSFAAVADLIRDLRAEIERLNANWDANRDALRRLADMDVLRARHEELRRDFEVYAIHAPRACAKDSLMPSVPCDCGLDEARKKWGGT